MTKDRKLANQYPEWWLAYRTKLKLEGQGLSWG
jgi:hypothetical protein